MFLNYLQLAFSTAAYEQKCEMYINEFLAFKYLFVHGPVLLHQRMNHTAIVSLNVIVLDICFLS